MLTSIPTNIIRLKDGVFPEIWKDAFMFPVFKNGGKRNTRSLSTASKLFEIIVSEVILTQSKSYISTDQHGFMPGWLITTNLLNSTNTCITAMAQVNVIYTHLKAAFDKIEHYILLAKLSRLGSSGKLVSWMRSYLTGRKLRVKIHGCVSSCNSYAIRAIRMECLKEVT
ncbi:uncharacterized protein LOC129771782 [Toxorhynchites rutilus septentrionalis]|uniref:uncharacterized protein LOC129771782 n=1 Tax=Toxorhynchites rutilus septentrionalis TaxID=329112 RepID=UPI00247B1EE7|nr:uncharacterized protein LOC129771782 [Toxorhynchites rutilus septentrionalis]